MVMKQRYECEGERTSAYLDGELDAFSRTLFEEHVESCPVCSEELKAQRLFSCELDSAFAQTTSLPLPKNFAQIVAVRAESDMRGVRDRKEHKRALRFCLILALGAFALLGGTTSRALYLSGWEIVNKLIGVFCLLWSTLRDAAVGLTVITRVICGGLIPESSFAGLAALLLALAVVLLSVLISSYHRDHEISLFE
jgi:predicted anti-sigma-YlaC factor YlaD